MDILLTTLLYHINIRLSIAFYLFSHLLSLKAWASNKGVDKNGNRVYNCFVCVITIYTYYILYLLSVIVGDDIMFCVKEVTEGVIRWIREWFEENGKGCNAVIGISGGKDSSVVAALCVEALGKDRVVGVLMPNGIQSDISDSEQLVAHLGIRHFVCNIKDATDGVIKSLNDCGLPLNEQARINLPPRIRMSTLYAVSQTLNGRVANTCNLSEDYVGYSTRYGDSAGDFSPLGKLTVAEVVQIGLYLGLPENLVVKTPSDGLSGQSDEDKLGFTYAVLDKYIRTGICEDEATKARIDRLNKINAFKLKVIPSYEPEREII